MRFLKEKIRLAQEALLKKSFIKPLEYVYYGSKSYIVSKKEEEIKQEPETKGITEEMPKKKDKKCRIKLRENEEDGFKCTKNVVINYGKAIASFASSELAVPYLKTFTEQENVSIMEFSQFITEAKDTIGGIASFRSLLLVEEGDDQTLATYKKIFRLISEVFIKYFSVNWIIHGRVTHKMTYLKYRFRMLRRVQNPEHFTYVRASKKKGRTS